MIPRIAAGTLAGVCLQPLYSRYVFVPFPITRYAWLGLIPPLLLAVCIALLCELIARAFPGERRARPFYQNSFALSVGVTFFMHAWANKVVWEAHPVVAAGVVATTTLVSFTLSGMWLRWRQLEQMAQAAAPAAASAGRPKQRR